MEQLQQSGLKQYLHTLRSNRGLALFVFALVAIYTLITLVIRAKHGLPYLYSVDDKHLVRVALRMLENRDPNPYWMGFPGAIIMYCLAVLYAAIIMVHFIFHFCITKDISNFNEYIEIVGKNWDFNPVVFHYGGRCLMIAVAVLTIIVLFYFTRKRFGIWSAVLAALCLSNSSFYLEHSIKIRPDIFASFMILLTLVFFVKFFENRDKFKYLILAGMFCGFSVSAKYPSAIVFLLLVVGAVILDYQKTKYRFWAYVVSNLKFKTVLSRISLFAFLGFFISTPYFFLDFNKTIGDLFFETRGGRMAVSRLPGIQNHLWYFNAVVMGMGGWLIFIISLAGLFKIICGRKISHGLFFSFPVVFFVFIGFTHLRWLRWIIPVLPFASILFGIGAAGVVRFFIKVLGTKGKFAIPIAAILGICFFVPSMKNNFHTTITYVNPETRTLAKEWFEQNIEEGAKVVCEVYGPQFWVKPLRKYEIINKGWTAVVSEPLESYRQQGMEYIILSYWGNDYFRTHPETHAMEVQRLQQIAELCSLVKQFDRTEKNRGPDIKIYQIPRQQ
jgi:hypothetical protein